LHFEGLSTSQWRGFRRFYYETLAERLLPQKNHDEPSLSHSSEMTSTFHGVFLMQAGKWL